MITSPHNDKLKEIRRLQRHAEDRFVAEGEDLVIAAERAGWPAVYVLEAGVDVEPVLLDAVSALGSGSRVIGVYERRRAAPAGGLCVALWGVRDPGNVGTVVRSALAFGATSVALGPDCADPYGPRAVRASMGAIFALPVARVDDPSALPGRVVALATRTGAPLSGPFDGDTTILVGAERAGLPDEVLAACDEVAHIPIAGDSLNAAMAATVALYEATRGQVPGAADLPDAAGAQAGPDGVDPSGGRAIPADPETVGDTLAAEAASPPGPAGTGPEAETVRIARVGRS